MSAPVYTLVSFGPTSAAGNFTTAHGLGRKPYGIEILMQSAYAAWLQTTWADSTNIYATASAAGAAGKFRVW